MSTTQSERLMKISTPLEEELLLNRMSASEALSKLFSYEIELLHRETKTDFKPHIVDIPSILGQPVSIELKQMNVGSRFFNGVVNRFSQGTRNLNFSFYYATVVPRVWILTQKTQSRIFQHKSVPDILNEVFKGFEVSFELKGSSYKPRNYCVQYRESDFDFASRLMEEEGIYYYFEHSATKHKMIIADTPQSHLDCPNLSDIPYFIDTTEDEFLTSIKRWQTDYQLQSGKVTFWDNHFQLPSNKLEGQQPSFFNVGGNQNLEIYDFPGGYARKYDDIDRAGGERSDLSSVYSDKEITAAVAMQALDAQYKTANGTSDCSSMIAGYRFKMFNHPNPELNEQYVITSISHEIEQDPSYSTEERVKEPYTNNFTCISHGGPAFSPLRKTLKPVIKGSQTAMVVGPAGEEIFTDKYGRVKVQFHWDRQGKDDADSSCWIRVGTLWAGKQWGVIHIPRIGQEVIVDFIEGDPDQPIIVGSIYNPQTMPPYDLPANKTQSGVKSRSSKGGGPANFNEFRFEDKKGKEEVYLHAEKDWTIMVENDKNQIVGHDETHLVKHDREKTVRNDEKTTIIHNRTETVGSGSDTELITINGFRKETVTKNETITVGKDMKHDVVGEKKTSVGKNETASVAKDQTINVGKKYTLTATNEINESSKTIKIQAGMELILSGPGGQIKIDASGVTITGVLVKIN